MPEGLGLLGLRIVGLKFEEPQRLKPRTLVAFYGGVGDPALSKKVCPFIIAAHVCEENWVEPRDEPVYGGGA